MQPYPDEKKIQTFIKMGKKIQTLTKMECIWSMKPKAIHRLSRKTTWVCVICINITAKINQYGKKQLFTWSLAQQILQIFLLKGTSHSKLLKAW